MMAAGGRSGWVSGIVFAALPDHVRSRDLGWVFPAETGFILYPDRDTVRSPDAAFVARHRLAGPPAGFVPLPTDLAVEVLSPTGRMADTLSKVGMYLDAGVKLVWLVDPETRVINVFTPDSPPLMLKVGDTLTGDDVLQTFSLPVSELFG